MSRSGIVLIVEGHDELRRLMARLVEGCGFEPLPSSGWVQAMRGCRDRVSEVVGAVIEAGGGTDGLTTLRALRDLRPGLPCVFVCGTTEPHTGPELLAAGCAWVLAKPFQIEHFQEAVRTTFGTG